MNEFKFTSPLSVTLPRKTKADKKVLLNLNVYRNLHFMINNQVKEKYCDDMELQLSGVKFDRPIKIKFVLWRARGGRLDRSNILSVVEKFFCDALVHYGCIKDDDDNHIISTQYETGGIDREYPRVEITIAKV